MMLHRSASSRRRRASRNVANASHVAGTTSPGLRGRRASVATDTPIVLNQTNLRGTMERHRSPRGSMVPNIALNAQSDSADEISIHDSTPDIDQYSPPCGVLITEVAHGSRSSLVPDDYSRSPRNSFAVDGSRSPRNSLVPDVCRSPRNSLTPEVSHSPRHSLVTEIPMSVRNSLVPEMGYNRSSRNSLVPLNSSRTSLMPENGTIVSHSPRHSLIPDTSRSPRGSVANLELADRSPRGSICPDVSRSPRGSITPLDVDRSPRGSIASECLNQSPRGSITIDPHRSPRGSIIPEYNRSPRTSICPETNRSPRGSIVPYEQERHPRGSIGGPNEEECRSPRGSIGAEGVERSPRGSIGVVQDRRLTKGSLGLPEPRRSSADQGISRNRGCSPHRQRDVNSGSVRSNGSTTQVNLTYDVNAFTDSRHASSSISQFSVDESRRLCMTSVNVSEKSYPKTVNLGVVTYGSVVFQLQDAHLEASSTCDFVFRGLKVVGKTTVVTVLLSCLFTMPILMFIFGVQFFKDCPGEPRIPVYMVVGGVFGTVHISLTLYTQIRSRKPEVITQPGARCHMSPRKLFSITLSLFLLFWFMLGNYWILRIKWPEYKAETYEPNAWCEKKLYIFSIVHLIVMYVVFGAITLVAIYLVFYKILAFPLPERYK